jgi:NADH-quinone oxidoreductase subunit G
MATNDSDGVIRTVKLVSLTIDGKPVSVPEGTLIVNAAKKIGIDIPVFCYHPKMEPVGMCRMCLVEIGRPVIDRTTGQVMLDEDGTPKVQFGAKLETACTTPVSEGMVVLGLSERAKAGREDIIEFILTSHPLDCPICDKGGECPLQNLTMRFGPGESRYLYDEKMHLAKHVPLGEMIYLDRERCIQCGRCVRFQEQLVDDPVIGFSQRGRALEIVTFSEPGFDSYFSGNTTDICPVGALTTADFRFRARPWELQAAASICNQCPVGCNLTYNVRREAVTGGRVVIKRAMPRQNEQVNEIWICDKGRFGYHYTDRAHRILQPMVRKNGELHPTSWDEALNLVAQRFADAPEELVTLAGGRLANEDLFNLSALTRELNGGKTDNLITSSTMAGGDLTAQVGFGQGTNFSDMGAETAILVVACDLEEEAPIWWLRVKQAADRGAKLIVVNPRPTKLDRYAQYILRYPYGSEAAAVLALANSLSAKRPELPESVRSLLRSSQLKEAAQIFAQAENGVVIYGSEGIGLDASVALSQACANLLAITNHVGRPNNGLLAVWQRANDQGAWDMGFRPVLDLEERLANAKTLYLVAVDPVGDHPALAGKLTAEGDDLSRQNRFIVVQELALTATARLADVVLPVQAYTEREGSYTSGERRVQRFYPAVPEPLEQGNAHAPSLRGYTDFAVTGQIAGRLGLDVEFRSAALVMARIAASLPDYAGITYQTLAHVEEQWPIVGREDMYYGGTTYQNNQGLGVQLQPAAQRGQAPSLSWIQPPVLPEMPPGLLAVPVTRLYDRGTTLLPAPVLQQRLPQPYVVMNPQDAATLHDGTTIPGGVRASVIIDGVAATMAVHIDEGVPQGIVLVPRSLGLPVVKPTPVQVRLLPELTPAGEPAT